MEELILAIIEKREELHRFHDAHHAGVFPAFDGLGDEDLDIVPQDIVFVVCRDLDNLSRRFGYLTGLTVNDNDTLGRFGATGEQLGNTNLQSIGEALKFRDGGITLYTSEKVADRSSHTVRDV
jgi:hypothetical protein